MVRRMRAKLVFRLRAEALSLHQIEAWGVFRHSVIKLERDAPCECLTWWEIAARVSDAEVPKPRLPRADSRRSAYA